MPWRLPLLALLVTAAHLWLADAVGIDRFGMGAARDVLPARMQVAFVRELTPRAPPAVAPVAERVTLQRRAQPAAAAASQPYAAAAQKADDTQAVAVEEPVAVPAAAPAQAAATAPPTAAAETAAAETAAAETAAAETAAAETAAASDAAAASAPVAPEVQLSPSVATAATAQAFAWPPSTRLSYTLTGHYRGPVEGQAQVEWLLEGARYQVHMDLSIGPAFAPLASRRVSSEGVVTPDGLSPRRYDEVTRALLRQPQHLTVWLDDDRVRLANGRVEARPAGVQDSASQFVHLTWLFTTQPALLRSGQSLSLPLALPRQLRPWVYDVVGSQMLTTPAGDVETFHVKPRRSPGPGNDLTAEIWVAPSLQYLPVRIVIRQDAETYLDLLIARLPQQAATGR